jgi:hypothetical protein
MKSASRILIFAIIIAITLAGGCGTAQRHTKPSVDQVPGGKASIAAGDTSQNNPGVREKPGQGPVPPPEPRYEPPAPTDRDKLLGGGVDPREKAEVTDSALEFARKNVPTAKHIKVCFSKVYGGWYMLLFSQKGKKMSMDHWNWNSKTKEWEVLNQEKNLPPERVENELRGDLQGEKCFVLK